MALYIIFGILMFGVLIFIHELGHFLAAKKCGVGIYEFSIGMGPKIFSRTGKDGIVYALRLLPIGGYVSMHGEDDDENFNNDETSLSKKSIPKRFFVIVAGAMMNILLGFIIAFFLVIFGGDIYEPTIERFNFGDENGNLIQMQEFQGLEVGDKIVKIGNRRINIWHDFAYETMNIVGDKKDLVVIRDEKKVIIKDFIFPTAIDEKTGIEFGAANFIMPTRVSKTPFEVIKQTICQPISIIRVTWTSLIDTVRGRYGTEALSGPVGVVSEMKEVEKTGGIPSLFFLMLIITINLGIMNLLPIPALDGGRLFLLIIEAIRRKPLSQKVEAAINAVGFMLLIGLMIFVTSNDIIKLFK